MPRRRRQAVRKNIFKGPFHESAPLGEQVNVISTAQCFEPLSKLPLTETLAPLVFASPPL